MTTDRDKRISKLERKRSSRAKVIFAWRDAANETADDAIARRCPKGVPTNASLVVCSWQCQAVEKQRAR
jgi:hypothetical protein